MAKPATTAARQHSRYEVDVSLRLFCLGRPGATPGRTADISLGGMSFYVPLALEPGTSVQLQFSLPLSEVELRLTATIRKVDGFCYGVEFSRLGPVEKREIEHVCRLLRAKSL